MFAMRCSQINVCGHTHPDWRYTGNCAKSLPAYVDHQ